MQHSVALEVLGQAVVEHQLNRSFHLIAKCVMLYKQHDPRNEAGHLLSHAIGRQRCDPSTNACLIYNGNSNSPHVLHLFFRY